jgi:uncharacterized protein (DUF4415 family)
MVDPDDAPELTDAELDETELYEGDRFVRRGRPKLGAPKNQVTLQLNPDLLDALRAGGPGWQSRLNGALRNHLKPCAQGRVITERVARRIETGERSNIHSARIDDAPYGIWITLRSCYGRHVTE